MTTAGTRIENVAPRAGDGGAATVPDPEIEREFKEFREAAVRLAERVRDLSQADPDPIEAARADLHLVRTIFGKWSSDVLIALHALPSAGFEELRRNLTGISPRVLSLKLKELEQNGMLHREILDFRPPRVRYSLTERGWTVAWLSQPVLLYLRFSDRQRPAPQPPVAGTRDPVAERPLRYDDEPERAPTAPMPYAAPRAARSGSRPGRSSIARSPLGTAAL